MKDLVLFGLFYIFLKAPFFYFKIIKAFILSKDHDWYACGKIDDGYKHDLKYL